MIFSCLVEIAVMAIFIGITLANIKGKNIICVCISRMTRLMPPDRTARHLD